LIHERERLLRVVEAARAVFMPEPKGLGDLRREYRAKILGDLRNALAALEEKP
jgi:hypothetical protein